MELLNRIEELEKELLELKEQVKEQQEFPQSGERYWCINGGGMVNSFFWKSEQFDLDRYRIGNMFKTEKEACFAVEKLKVEEELRKFSRPFKHGAKNHTINYNHETEMVVNVNATATYQETGSFYFDSYEEVVEAIKSVGEDRIKKYIFGVED